MRNFILLVIVFAAGAMLGWYTHEYLAPAYPPPLNTNVLPSKKIAKGAAAIELERSQDNSRTGLDDLLERGDYESALGTYEALLNTGDDDPIEGARDQLLSHASTLIARQQHGTAQNFLESLLALTYRDVDARILLARAYLAEQSDRQAIVNYYIAKGHAYRVETIKQLNGLIRLAVTNEATLLERNHDYRGLLELYENVTQLEPDYAPYFIGLAKAHLSLNNTDAARRSLLLVRQDADVGHEAQAMLAELQLATLAEREVATLPQPIEVSGVALHRQGHHFLVDGEVGNAKSVRLLIDTGASMTIVTPDTIERAGRFMRNTGKIGVFDTANGPVRSPIYSLDSLAVGDWQVNKLDVGVLALGGHSGIDGLLGMNFLSHFQFFIDQNQAVLRLSTDR